MDTPHACFNSHPLCNVLFEVVFVYAYVCVCVCVSAHCEQQLHHVLSNRRVCVSRCVRVGVRVGVCVCVFVCVFAYGFTCVCVPSHAACVCACVCVCVYMLKGRDTQLPGVGVVRM